MNSRIVDPPLDQLHKLPTPLTVGERLFLNALLSVLPEAWEIYIQPHLNGLRPDFVLLHPERGIAVYEVKDWDLDALQYAYRRSRETDRFELVASNGIGTFRKNHDDPVARVLNYKREIFELYCPDLPEGVGFGAITAGVVFPFAPQAKVAALCRPALEFHKLSQYPRLYPIICAEHLSIPKLHTLLPNAARVSEGIMNPIRAEELRHWLVDPDYASDQRAEPAIDGRQRILIEGRSETGYRRLRGPAGSGKSLVLAGRAANLARQGKRVLVVTYNITLINYLRDLVARFGRDRRRDNIQWLNFHLWCKRICIDTGHQEDYRALWRDVGEAGENGEATKPILDERLAALVSRILSEEPLEGPASYDAILVDEGQDYRLSWWQALRLALRPGGEMLLVADTTQNVYGTARSWTEQAMAGAGFRGLWSELRTSYRLPEKLLVLAKDFAETYLPADTCISPQPITGELPFPSAACELRWIQVACNDQLPSAALDLIDDLLRRAGDSRPAVADITVIVPTEKIGRSMVQQLRERKIRSIHTFPAGNEGSRKLKMHFYKGDARVKVTTVKSFKGWESSVIVALITSGQGEEHLSEVYAALTRVKRSETGSFLSVACADSQLRRYGATWPVYASVGGRAGF